MSTLKNLEHTLAEWQKKSPVHLPETVRKWLGDNAWWLVIVGIALSILSVIGSLRTLFWAEDVLRQARQLAISLGVDVPGNSLAMNIGLWISLITFVVVIVIELKSIQPLRSKKQQGWDLTFLAVLISIVGSFIAGIIQGAVAGTIIGTIIGAVIAWFFLFEIRSQFLPTEKTKPTFKPSEKSTPKS